MRIRRAIPISQREIVSLGPILRPSPRPPRPQLVRRGGWSDDRLRLIAELR
jgi:hypothetical protein